MEQFRGDLLELLEFLQGAEDRATERGDAAVAEHPANSRYACEVGSLLATCDGAIQRVRAIMARFADGDDI